MELIKTVFEFLVITVLFKYIIVKWVAQKLSNIFERYMVKSRREAAIWLHYQNAAMNKGHNHKTPLKCQEGACKIFHPHK